MLKYLLNQITQMCTWFGLCVVVAALFATRGEIAFLGFIMIALHDDVVKNFISKHVPSVAKWIQQIADEI